MIDVHVLLKVQYNLSLWYMKLSAFFQEWVERKRCPDPLITAYAQISELKKGQVFVRIGQ